jgi:hypothetical protein
MVLAALLKSTNKGEYYVGVRGGEAIVDAAIHYFKVLLVFVRDEEKMA